MEDFTLQVTPEILLSSATEISSKVNTIKAVFSEISRKMKDTSVYWNGSAAELNRSLFQNQEPEMEAIISRFLQQATVLKEIAKNFIKATEEMVAVVEDLPGDVIV